jgi:hypothetical protein
MYIDKSNLMSPPPRPTSQEEELETNSFISSILSARNIFMIDLGTGCPG